MTISQRLAKTATMSRHFAALASLTVKYLQTKLANDPTLASMQQTLIDSQTQQITDWTADADLLDEAALELLRVPVRFDLEPNIGYETPEPSLRALLTMYYFEKLFNKDPDKKSEADGFVAKYIAEHTKQSVGL